MARLKDLPVRPGLTGNVVQEAYVKELYEVKTPEELKKFVTRWLPLYNLHSGRDVEFDKRAKDAKRFRISMKNLNNLRAGNIDFVTALDCIQKCRTDPGCAHQPHFSCEGAHIILPLVMMRAHSQSEYWGVSTDIALIQANGGLEALEGT